MATWFVTGSGRGLGYEIARRALDEGANIIATAGSSALVVAAFAGEPGFAQRCLRVALDVTDEGQVAAAVASAMSWFGRIDYHGQMNEPVKGAAAIYAAVTAPDPPGRFQVGPDAIAMVESKLAHVREEPEAWRSLGSSTRFSATDDTQVPRPGG